MRYLIAATLFLFVSADTAEAKRIAVAKFRGVKTAKTVRASIVKAVKKSHTYVSTRADEVDGVVRGSLKRSGKRYKLRIVIEDSEGEKVKSMTFKIKRSRLSKKQSRKLAKKIRSAIAKIPDPPEDEDEDEDDYGDEDEDDDRVASSDDDDSDADDDDAAASVSRGVETGTAPALPPAQLAAGFSFVRRDFGFGAADGNYYGGLAPGLMVDAEFYPMAFNKKNKGQLPKVGIGVFVDRVLKLESQFVDSMASGVTLPTSQTRYGVDVRYRHAFGDSRRSAHVIASVGVEKLSFEIDKSGANGATILVPNVNYTMVDPGLSMFYPINKEFAAFGEVKGMLVLAAGEITTPGSYGAGTALGFEGRGGVDYIVKDNISVRAAGQVSIINFSLNGDGMMSGNGAFTKAVDRYLGLNVSAAYQF